jgi:lysophospholipase L1-like esterase
MKNISLHCLLVVASLAFLPDAKLFGQTTNTDVAGTNAVAPNTAIIPVLRTNPTNWVARHEGFVEIAKKGNVDLLFMGDSITDGWRGRGLKVWNKYYASQHAANFGIGGDRTEHVLWRMDNGELDGLKPKVCVLMIGTNNTGKDKNGHMAYTIPQVIEAVTAIVTEIHAKLPETKILLLAIFPRGNIDDFQRGEVAVINQALDKLDNGGNVKFLDIGSKFLDADGTLPRSIMPDLLHPNEKGYQIWADAMNPTLDEMMK